MKKPTPTKPQPSLSPTFLETNWAIGIVFIHLLMAPLVFSQKMHNSFELVQSRWLILHAILLTGWMSLRWFYQGLPQQFTRNRIGFGVALLMLSLTLSTMASIDSRSSFWGLYDSFGGWVTCISYGVLFFAVSWCIQKKQDIHTLCQAIVAASGLVSIYAIFQGLGWDPIPWERSALIGNYQRPGSTLGHPNLLGSYLAISFPLVLWQVRHSYQQNHRRATVWFSLVAAMVLVSCGITLSRGAFAALLGTCLFLALGCLAQPNLRWKQRSRAIGLIAILLVGILGGTGWVLREAPWMGAFQERLTRGFDTSNRSLIWQASVKIFLDHPILGSGPDTFALTFPPHRTASMWEEEWGVTPSRVHNEFLQVLTTQGTVGILALLFLVAVSLRECYRLWHGRTRASSQDRFLTLALMASLLAFAIQSFFSFTTAALGSCAAVLLAIISRIQSVTHPATGKENNVHPSLPLEAPFPRTAWIIASLLVGIVGISQFWMDANHDSREKGLFLTLAWMGALFICRYCFHPESWKLVQPSPQSSETEWSASWREYAVAVLILGGIWQAVITPSMGDLAAGQAKQLQTVNPDIALEKWQKACEWCPQEPYYWGQWGHTSEMRLSDETDTVKRKEIFGNAQQAYAEAQRLHPLGIHSKLDILRLAHSQLSARLPSDSETWATLDQLIQKDPNNVYYYVDASQLAYQRGDLARGLAYVEAGLQRYPMYAPLFRQRAMAELAQNRPLEAAKWVKLAIDKEWKTDYAERDRMLQLYAEIFFRLNRPEDALFFAQLRLVKEEHSETLHAIRNKALKLCAAQQAAKSGS